MFLDEFAPSLDVVHASYDNAEGARAADLYERIFVGYGDDSVAQLGGAHIACEWVSNVLTKVLQRPRLGAYLEQSTRYIAYDAPMPRGGYRYYEFVMAAFVAVLLCSNLVGPAKVAQLDLPLVGAVTFGARE